MGNLIALGGYQTLAIDSIEKYRTNDCDGPASINNNFTKQGSVGFPAAVMLAATWNDDMATAFGESIGKMKTGFGGKLSLSVELVDMGEVDVKVTEV